MKGNIDCSEMGEAGAVEELLEGPLSVRLACYIPSTYLVAPHCSTQDRLKLFEITAMELRPREHAYESFDHQPGRSILASNVTSTKDPVKEGE